MIPKLASKYTCTGCMACIDSCPTDALFSIVGNDGHLYIDCNDDLCISCQKCEKTCPVVNDFVYQKEENTSVPYAAWASDEIRVKSASGGVFAAVAYKIIEDGGYVVGAIMDGFEVKHIISNQKEDIVKMQGSKYQHGKMTTIYKEVRKKLREDTFVLFSGLPCQVGALYSFLGKQSTERLITMDLICSGVPSQLPLKTFVKQNKSKNLKSVVSFRNKDTAWKGSGGRLNLRMLDKDDNIVDFGNNNFVSNAFSAHMTSRYSCFGCEFTGNARKSDFSLADFWGLKDYKEYQAKGISLLICHSKEKLKYLELAQIIYKETEWKLFLPFNPRMSMAKALPKYDPVRLSMGWFFNNAPYSTLNKLYGSHIEKKDILWIPYKIYRYVLYKIFKRRTNRHIAKQIKNIEK